LSGRRGDEQTDPLAAEFGDEIADLARALQGVIDHAAAHGLQHLPRPSFAAAPAAPAVSAPAAPAPTPTPIPTPTPTPIADDVAVALRALIADPRPAADRLKILEAEIVGDCRRCKLHRGRTKLVFGSGSATARVAFVGEGPGADEDRQGQPFVGRAGQLLTKMIEAMGLARDDVYICNVVKCRPPNNRDPEPDEVEACERFLRAQLAIVKPTVVVALGRYAAQTLLKTQRPITRLRGTWQTYEGVAVMPTYHPSYLLREPDKKREAWSDLQLVMAKLKQP
jgi:uracil-DNA glycosylase